MNMNMNLHDAPVALAAPPLFANGLQTMRRAWTMSRLLLALGGAGLLACGGSEAAPAGPGSGAGGEGAGGEGAGGEGGETGGGGDGGTASDVPLVDEALDEASCPAGSKPPGNGVAPGDDLHKVTLDAYPDAVCNDGSPAVMYVRRATSAATEDDWVIHLQAGGGCSSWEVCRDRWCAFETSYDAAKMSTRFSPEVANGSGLFARTGPNAFGDANQVYVYYCSSDGWRGTRSDVVLDTPEGGDGPSFRVHFRGYTILQAVVDALDAGVTSDDDAETLPSLGTASRVLFSGSSAGATGVTHALDWFREQVPEATVAGSMDSINDPIAEDIDDLAVRDKWVLGSTSRYTSVELGLYAARLDESCLAAHPGDDAYLCGETSHVRLHHLTTPFFTRQDLRDPVQFGYFGLTGASLGQFADALHKTMLRFPGIRQTAEEKDDIVRAPGVHVSNCAQHIVMLNAPWFGVAAQNNATVETDGGVALTVHDALGAWIGGTAVAAIDTHPSTVSTCAATTNDQ